MSSIIELTAITAKLDDDTDVLCVSVLEIDASTLTANSISANNNFNLVNTASV
jgi:hypothetical protein